jgi:hypothetical protein
MVGRVARQCAIQIREAANAHTFDGVGGSAIRWLAIGQSADEAIDAIVAQCRTILEATTPEDRIRKMPTPPFAKKAQ